MKSRFVMLLLVLGTLVPLATQAATVTATCKDGTSFSGASRKGACAGHGGVQAWGTTATTPIASPAATSGSATTAKSRTGPQPTRPAVAKAAGAGTGQVWVNTSSKVYHCAGTRWYGKTKNGQYMTEAAAKSEGFRPAQGKACTS